MSRRGWGALAGAAAIVVAAAGIAAAVFDPSVFKPRIEQAVVDATGRAVTLNGPIRIGWSLPPTIEATDVSLANLVGGSRPDIVHVERIQAALSLRALFRREIEVTDLTLTGPNILFEQVAGKPNWLISAPAQASTPPPVAAPAVSGGPPFRIAAVHIRNGMVTWRFPAFTKVIGIRSLDLLRQMEGGPVDLAAVLVYSDFAPFELQASAQPSGGLRDPWTTRLRATAFDTTAAAAGMIDLDGSFDLQLDATAGALEKLNALLPEMRLPPLHGVSLSTHVRNGPTLGTLPVLGATKLHVDSANLGSLVTGLVLGASDLTVPEAGGTATVASALRFGGQPFALSGTVGIPRRLVGAVSIPLDLKAQGGGDAGGLALKGALALDTLRFRGLDGAASLRAPALAALRPVISKALPALTDIRFDGHVAIPADRSAIAFKGARLQAREGDVSGDWTLGLQDQLAIEGKLAASRLDLDAALVAFGVALPPTPALAGASGPAISTAALPWALLRGPRVDLSARVAALSFQGEVWRDVSLAMQLKAGRLSVSPVTLSLPDGPLHLDFTMDASGEAGIVAIELRAPGIPLSLVARYAGLPGPMTGAVRIEAQLHAAGGTPHAMAATLAGPVSATLVGGRMTNAAFIMLTGASLEALGIKVPAQGETALRCMGLVGSFEKGVGLLKTIALDTTWLQLDGSGRIDFGNETVALKLNPMTEISGSSVAVPVIVEGPFHAIRGRLDADGLDKLGLFINGLFGGDRSTACRDAGLVPAAASTAKP